MKTKKNFILGTALLLAFCFFTFAVKVIDVQAIGPQKSTIGFATINNWAANFLGRQSIWYQITEWLGLIAVMVALFFAFLGFIQMYKRRSIKQVDQNILLLGLFYAILIAVYLLFEKLIVNYRPVIMESDLEAAYPSSHTVIAFFILLSACLQAQLRIKNVYLKRSLISIAISIAMLTIIGRLLSGVHWLTDIIGGLLLGTALLVLYDAAVKSLKKDELLEVQKMD